MEAEEGSSMTKLDMENRSLVERQIAGALKSTIRAHGPIDNFWVGSAAKRIYGQLKAIAREQAGK